MRLEKKTTEQGYEAGIGWRGTCNGKVMFQGNDRILATSALHAEAHAVLREALARNFDSVLLQTDSMQIRYAITAEINHLDVYSIVLDIGILLPSL